MGGHISKKHQGVSDKYKQKREVRDKRELHRLLHKVSRVLYESIHPDGDLKNYNRTEMRTIKALLISEDNRFSEL